MSTPGPVVQGRPVNGERRVVVNEYGEYDRIDDGPVVYEDAYYVII